MFHFIIVYYTFSSVWLLSGHLLGNSCPFGWPFVLIFVIFLFITHFGFKSVIWLLFAPVPVHCFLILLIEKVSFNKYLGKGKGSFELIIIIS